MVYCVDLTVTADEIVFFLKYNQAPEDFTQNKTTFRPKSNFVCLFLFLYFEKVLCTH